MKKLIFTFLLVSYISELYSQDSLKLKDILPGKWKVCLDTQFDSAYTCNNPYTAYTIFADGTYTEDREVFSGGIRFQVTGKWSLQNITLIMLDDAKHGYSQSHPHRRPITLINKDIFYIRSISTIEDPGQVYYTYFRRIN